MNRKLAPFVNNVRWGAFYRQWARKCLIPITLAYHGIVVSRPPNSTVNVLVKTFAVATATA